MLCNCDCFPITFLPLWKNRKSTGLIVIAGLVCLHGPRSAIDVGLHWARHVYSVHVGNRGRDRCCVDVLAAAGEMGKVPLVEGIPA